MTWLTLATEDEISEQVGLRLIRDSGFEVGLCLRNRGNGYLRKRVSNFCEMAKTQPVLLITDLDQIKCPEELIKDWLGTRNKPDNLIFRIAVREIESWLLADHEGIRHLFGRKTLKLPVDPDDLADPKQTLLRLAENAVREVRDDLVVSKGSVAAQGLGYNSRLSDWIRDSWDPERASSRSSSLKRTQISLTKLRDRLNI
ncbi:DUF4276 family protein [Burkholderia ubonensis]|uniref:DUF4276 family protein n=1 Tax=Burkholderia ubonensis TaxID=101571 RepID=UPI0012F84A57|nr:DUF4276 family protein [Burkholderia ubonensis]